MSATIVVNMIRTGPPCELISLPSLYDTIMSDVVEQSRADFQKDDGSDEATLQEYYAISSCTTAARICLDLHQRWTEKIAATSATSISEEKPGAPVETEDDSVSETLTTTSQSLSGRLYLR